MKLTAIAITVIAFTIVSAALSSTESIQIGPPLVTPGFSERVKKAIAADTYINYDYLLMSTDKEREFAVYAGKEKGEVLIIREVSTDQFSFTSVEATNEHGTIETVSGKKSPIKYLNLRDLNRIIDEKVFPDQETRSPKKQEILNRISNLLELKRNETPNWKRYKWYRDSDKY